MQQNAHSDSPMLAESFPTDPTGLPEAAQRLLRQLRVVQSALARVAAR